MKTVTPAKLFLQIEQALQQSERLLIAIDGRCGSGKTTLAIDLAARYGGCVFHMDDFYLPFDRRIPDWKQVPGANMDFARLRNEVLAPVQEGRAVHYLAHRPHLGSFEDHGILQPCRLSILEGSYSHHPSLQTAFDLRIYVTCDPEVQRQRLQMREGERYAHFRDLWIPLEEAYFSSYSIEEQCDLCLSA